MGSFCDMQFRVAPATAIAGSTTDFFTAVTPAGGARVLSFSVSLDTGVKLYARLNGVNCVLNSDTALTANALYTFTIIVSGADTITFRASAACGVNYMVGVVSLE